MHDSRAAAVRRCKAEDTHHICCFSGKSYRRSYIITADSPSVLRVGDQSRLDPTGCVQAEVPSAMPCKAVVVYTSHIASDDTISVILCGTGASAL